MLRKQQKPAKPPARYDVNRTLANIAYTPQSNTAKPNPVPLENDYTPETSKPKSRFGWKKRLLLLFILLLTPLLVIAGWDISNASSASKKLFGTGNVAGALLPTGLENSSERVNILMVGYSADDPGHAGALLTDSIMVVSLDKQDKTGYMLSVPRDLFVDIPNYGAAKINEAYQAGEQQGFSQEGYPAGGIGMVNKIVSDNFKIPLHYYVIINYGAVRDTVDALNGVTVDIKSPDPRGLLDPNFKPEEGGALTLANGPQLIDGQTALRLTRARGSTLGSYGFPQSDFNRTQNQQAVFAAIKSELDYKLILDPRINKKFFDAIANNVQTDMKLSEVLPVFRLLQSSGNLRPVNLSDVGGVNLLGSYTTRTGQSALIPAAGIDDFTEIQATVNRLSQ